MNASIHSFSAAFDSLGANPLRTALSTLGVVIGVAALVAILALSDGLERFGREQIRRSTDLQSIVIQPRVYEVENGVRVLREDVPRLDASAAGSLRDLLAGRADVALFVMASARASVPGDTARHIVQVVATVPEAESQLREGLAAGRYLTAEDVASNARAVVVPPSAGEWYGVSSERLPGRILELDGVAYEVVGVNADEGGSAVLVHVPLGEEALATLTRPDRLPGLAVRAHRVEEVEAIGQEVDGWLASRFGDAGRFAVASRKAMAEEARLGMLVFKLVMGSIAGISLLVGGIGIMNILLASVIERTREIGIRKASGARQRDILLQFLSEAVAITGFGSLLGVVVGLVGAFAITAVIRQITEAPIQAAFTWGSVLVAATAAILIGLAFGTYPARRAARLSPIEAIRHE